jgi:hypothetical protein
MALANYTDLKAAITDFFMGRSDISSNADDFIALTEGLLNITLRCREMETTADLTPSSNVCTIPTDYLEYKRVVELSSIRRRLEYITEEAADELYPTRTAGLASHFIIIGDSLTALPLSSNDIELTYYQKVPGLTEAAPTNWLLTRFPNIYLSGCLFHAADFVKDQAEMAKHGGLFAKYTDMLNGYDARAKLSGATLTIPGPVW